ncbi:hypothetical protein [Desulfovibrio psychrotolerans]|uniref:Alkylhydroperoxidase n=1 Tax=Desulfovibrio psychrotolerans TaxID=415242 RepID=A0A7J0BW30_9BACT|nr:hypothetical protein [Desulfovibrio psychrotolerans]GFM37920.1 hypothetical protein DSM19430T_26040 [Desulfovibrio psychrotolerans]
MYSIRFTTPQDVAAAPESVQKIYAAFPSPASVPEPLQLFSASPHLLEKQFELIRHYTSHPALSFPLLAAIRYTVARSLGYGCCTEYNSALLQRCGMNKPDLEALYDHAAAPADLPALSGEGALEDHEQLLLRLVAQAVVAQQGIPAQSLAEARTAGWEDRDIFDAVAHGANMLSIATMDRAFRQQRG